MKTAAIWNEFHEQLLRFIHSRIHNMEVAEDLLQEVFVKIHQHQGSLRENQKITSWIYQITRNTIIEYYRRQAKQDRVQEMEATFVEDDFNTSEDLTACLKPFIHQLSDKYKDILMQTTYGHLSQKEYAAQHGLSYTAAKSRMQRARKAMYQLFTDCCAIEADRYGNVIAVENKKCNNC